MLWRVIEPEVLPLCTRQGVGQLAFQPLAQGVLTGKYRPGQAWPEGSRAASGGRAPRFINRVLGEKVLLAVEELRPVAEASGLSLAQLAIAWVLSRPGVASVVMGATRPEQADDEHDATATTIHGTAVPTHGLKSPGSPGATLDLDP
ncbi:MULTISPECIES: aldo/keto reductase [unclassified Micromonospora]|uniref:aldo/keto reductase n=1 Tax=unclassified Micromonospora TaxID=2617518 RepID=UPI00259CEBDF|nr:MULTISPECIES: aldo/keto reductase [unclassified Micromonospora]MDM4777735.1 aldo/keto reductase [Micromonospora sp. b486]MDM4783263.1 aldo/keto reductase [Micromonospora sp. b486]